MNPDLIPIKLSKIIAIGAKQIACKEMDVVVGGGVESISLVQNQFSNNYKSQDRFLLNSKPDIYMSMIETAETVSNRYGIKRDIQDEYALQSQQRTAAAQTEGKFNDEIVPLKTNMDIINKETIQNSKSRGKKSFRGVSENFRNVW